MGRREDTVREGFGARRGTGAGPLRRPAAGGGRRGLVALLAATLALAGWTGWDADRGEAGGHAVAAPRTSPAVQATGSEERAAGTDGECAVPEVAGPAESGAASGVAFAAPEGGGVTIRIEFAEGTPEAGAIAPVVRRIAPAPIPAAARATPAATPDPAAALADELAAVAGALAACLSDGEARTVALLATEDYLGQLYGVGDPLPREEYLALAADLDPVPTLVRSVRDVRRVDAGEATAEVVSVVGNQLLRARWTFVQAPPSERDDRLTTWRVDAETPLPFEAPAGARRLEVAIEEYAFGLPETEAAGPVVALEGRNAGAEDHELLVLRLDGGAAPADLLREPGPGLPAGVAYVGQVTVPAGERAELVLVDLDPGDYAVVCLFPTERGTPHLALGMEAAFTVE